MVGGETLLIKPIISYISQKTIRIFSVGQAYVALSIVTNLQGVHLINIDFHSISAIVEYNHLRANHCPDLSLIIKGKPTKKKVKDGERAMKKGSSDVQEIYFFLN